MTAAIEGPIRLRLRLCDDAGMVSHQRVEPGSPGTIFDPDLTYLKLLNNLRANNRNPDAQVPYTGEPFACTGSAHLAELEFVCTNPIHWVEREAPSPAALDAAIERIVAVIENDEGAPEMWEAADALRSVWRGRSGS